MASVAPEILSAPAQKSWTSRVEQFVEAINQKPGVVLLALGVFYLLLVIPLALIKLLWADEFITFYIAKVNSVHGVWSALAQGADPNPPLSHLLVMWSMRLFGESAFALRIPAMLAVLLGVESRWSTPPRVLASFSRPPL
jgi:uncharacterized membrane protein